MSLFDAMFSELAEPLLMETMGQAAVYRPAAGGTIDLTAMIGGEEWRESVEGDGERSVERVRSITISTDPGEVSNLLLSYLSDSADAPAHFGFVFGVRVDPGVNDQVDLGGVAYEVRSASNKSGNLVTLECVRLESTEKSRPGYRGRR